MKLIVISSAKDFPDEIDITTQLFNNGLELFHLRKTELSQKDMACFLDKIPQEFHNRIVIHSNHSIILKYNLRGVHLRRKHRKNKLETEIKLNYFNVLKPQMKVTTSFHSLEGLLNDTRKYDYVFLSPIFDSISKRGYPSKFRDHNLTIALSKVNHKVIALGGVDLAKVELIKNMNFSGMALHGVIWESKNPVDEFMKIKSANEQTNCTQYCGL